jgi:hypothetical protein
MKGRTTSNFSDGLGPGGAHQVSFLFHCNTWTDIFFIDTNCLLLVRERDHRELARSPKLHATCRRLEDQDLHSRYHWGSSWARACNILLGGTRLDLGHLHKPGPMWSSPGLTCRGWCRMDADRIITDQPDRPQIRPTLAFALKRGFTF